VRKYFLIIAVIFFIPLKGFSQAEISIECQDQWGAGRYNKMSVLITFETDGFARFTLDFPVGFDVAGTITQGCDLSWNGNQLNAVFMNIKQGRSEEFSCYMKPENTMKGPFSIHGEVVIISGGVNRHTVKLAEKTIDIGGTNGLLAEEMKDKPVKQVMPALAKIKPPAGVNYSSKTVFRVQVSASSKVFSEARLRKEMGLDDNIKISVIKSVNVYKYQAGEYADYDSAFKLLKKLKERGVKDAFIVTYNK
jgi:hypothetical protein